MALATAICEVCGRRWARWFKDAEWDTNSRLAWCHLCPIPDDKPWLDPSQAWSQQAFLLTESAHV